MSGALPVAATADVNVVAIREAHALAQSSARDAVAHAIRAGELLIEAKRALAHGRFGAWVAASFDFTQRMAQQYMRVAGLSDEKRNTVSYLSLRGALTEAKGQARVRSAAPIAPATPKTAKKQRRRPTISNVEYLALRQTFINSVIARCVPSVKRAAGELLGTDELAQLREAICAVVDQFIHRADGADTKHPRPELAIVNERGTK